MTQETKGPVTGGNRDRAENKNIIRPHNSQQRGQNQALAAALSLLEASFSVLPVNGDKRPRIKWEAYQKTPMTEADAWRHFANGARLAVICGKVSGNLECLDFDDPATFQPFLELLALRCPGLPEKLLHRRTPSGGYHLIYRCTDPVAGNLKLATDLIEIQGEGEYPAPWDVNGKKYQAQQIDGKWCIQVTAIETRGEGGYFVSAPSPGYEVLSGSLTNCATLTPEELRAIHDTAKAFDQGKAPAAPLFDNKRSSTGDAPGHKFNQAHTVAEILEAHGWKPDRLTSAGTGFTRPGKDAGTSGVQLKTGNFYCWSSNAAPLASGKSYSPFALYAAYNHVGDFSAAAKALAGAARSMELVEEKTKHYRKVVAIDIATFLTREFPPRSNLLSPWLPSQGLTMVYAYRGIGKTHFALGVAYAVASGGSFLCWQALEPVGVLYIDGEMPAPVMQERLSSIITSNDQEPAAPFLLLTPDLQPEGMPRLDTEEGQTEIESILTDEIKLIVVDNISTLSGAKENEADGWTPIQAWALKQRASGRSVLFVHHSGKGGAQRGTSRREDVLDTVIALRRPVDYEPDKGAVFEVHFEKARGIHGEDVKPIEATLTTDDHGRMTWCTRTVEDSTFDRVVGLLNEGMTQSEIANELNINKSSVSRHAKKAKATGLVECKKEPLKRKGALVKRDIGGGLDELTRGAP